MLEEKHITNGSQRCIWLWNHDATCMFSNKGGRHYWFAKILKLYKWNSVIFCSNINHFTGEEKKIKGRFEEKLMKDILFVFLRTTPYHGNGLSRVRNWISFYMNLFPVSKKISNIYGKPDVILASSVHPLTMVAGIQIAKKMGIPCICEIRDLWPEAIFNVKKAKPSSLLGRLLVAGEHWIYKHANALIFTKEGDIDYLTENQWLIECGGDIKREKCHYINNGVDLEDFYSNKEKNSFADRDLDSDKFKVIYTGTIRKVNNLEFVLETAQLLMKYDDIVFIIYGEGEHLDYLKEKAKSLELKNVIFKGYVNKQYIPYILSKSSVNLLNYSQTMYNWTRGNSSNKLFEYMASGKPIISTVKMGYSIIEKYHCGISLGEFTPNALANAVLYIRNMNVSERKKMGENAEKGAQDFDFKILTQKLLGVVEDVLKATGKLNE